mmetsp:Transcript_17301/g.41008  ORF Transcript_17301/g.41008 Transcript_17301/m.41008 type:complete len:335 (-) Transcript_17301:282-1286(-)
MNCVSNQYDVTIGPTSQELRWTIVQIPLLDRIRWSRIEDRHYLIGPALMKRFDVVNQILLRISLPITSRATPSRRSLFGSRRKRKECIPLNTTITNIRGNKVALRSDVDLVSCLIVVGRLDDSFTSKDGVATVRASLPPLKIGRTLLDLFSVHLCPHCRPNAIGTNQNIRIGRRSVRKGNLDALVLSQVFIRRDGVAVLDEVRLELFAFVDQNLLQIGTVHNARVGQSVQIGALLQGELDEPIGGGVGIDEVVQRVAGHAEGAVGPQPVLDAAGARPREGELVHDAVEQPLVDLLEDREGIGRKLDRTAEAGKGGRLFVDGHVEAALEHAKGGR